MAINYAVQADVVDITTDTPKAADKFLVDTNVWYWMTYTRASLCFNRPKIYQTSNYPKYTNAALAAGAKIFQSGLSFAELTHLIEKAEREIYEATNGEIRTKEYRHNLIDERRRIVREVNASWAQVSHLAEPLELTIDAAATSAALNRFKTEKLDGYDLFFLESMSNYGVVQVITDDGDFCTVPGIQVFTANRSVINAARNQGRIITR